jgi:hypothetical protein
MALNLQECQRSSIVRMLQLKTEVGADERRLDSVPQWKVLVYDRSCQDIIAPILKVCTSMFRDILSIRLDS